MIYGFEDRRILLTRRFRDAFRSAKNQGNVLDMLFSGIYLQWVHKPVIFPSIIAHLKPKVRNLLKEAADADSTQAVASLCERFISSLPKDLSDMSGSYFTIEIDEAAHDYSETLEERKDPVDGDEKVTSDEDAEDPEEEELPSWHAEDDEDEEGFLSFDLNEGQKMDLMGEGEREADSGDQALASVEGSAQSSDSEDYDEKETKNSTSPKEDSSLLTTHSGRANRFAKAIYPPSRPITSEDKQNYIAYRSSIEAIEKPLKRSIQKTLEQKMIAPRESLHAGRLGKKLLGVLTEDHPRLFYKKNLESNEWDAAFSLLVDCSASMYDKIEQLKTGLVLFHETLYDLKISHAITGFYEDALSSDASSQPNYFHEVLPFEKSLLPGTGASIMQLSAEEDNRDGFAIRTTGEKLKRAPEKHKLLLVFTDGEPSAHQYNDEGIVDTQEAVIEMRRQGVDVIGIFLADDEASQEREIETMHAIYGQQSLIIPSISEIPARLQPLLKKLLFKYL